MNQYELIVLFHPDLEIDIDNPITKLEQLIESAGGKIVKRDNWGKRRLAYKIKTEEFGVYVYFEILLPPTKVRDIESSIIINEEIIRHLLIKRDSKAEKPKSKKVKPKTTQAKAITTKPKVKTTTNKTKSRKEREKK